MGITQTKRQQAIDNTVAANAQVNTVINTADDPCNIHGLIIDIRIGSLSTGLSFGQWAVTLMPRVGTNAPVLTTSTINSEIDNPVFWMLGSWMTDLTGGLDRVGGAPRTSRNCPRGGRLQFNLENSAVSGSGIRFHGTATWFEVIK